MNKKLQVLSNYSIGELDIMRDTMMEICTEISEKKSDIESRKDACNPQNDEYKYYEKKIAEYDKDISERLEFIETVNNEMIDRANEFYEVVMKSSNKTINATLNVVDGSIFELDEPPITINSTLQVIDVPIDMFNSGIKVETIIQLLNINRKEQMFSLIKSALLFNEETKNLNSVINFDDLEIDEDNKPVLKVLLKDKSGVRHNVLTLRCSEE